MTFLSTLLKTITPQPQTIPTPMPAPSYTIPLTDSDSASVFHPYYILDNLIGEVVIYTSHSLFVHNEQDIDDIAPRPYYFLVCNITRKEIPGVLVIEDARLIYSFISQEFKKSNAMFIMFEPKLKLPLIVKM